MKKYILKSLFVSMLCMLAASCQDTNEFDQLDSSKAQVSFSIAMDSPLSRSRSTDNTWGGEYDNYVGDDYDNRIALDELVVKIEADGGKKYTLSNIIKWQAGAGNEYSFVGVIENLKSPVSLENARISVYANMGRNADETTFAQDAADCIPMWGMQFMESLTLTPAKRVPLPSISLLRAMAKIEVALNDEMKEDYTLTGATLDKVNPNGYPMPKSGVVNGTKTTTELGFEEGFNPLEGTKVSLPLIEGENGSWYIYLPEMMKENNPKITVQLNDGDETGTFSVKRYVKDQEPQAMDIVRNHWYKYIISGFDASEITVEYKTVDWKDKFIEIGGDGFLFLNKDVIEIYNSNIDADQLKFSSSSPIKSIELKDLYTHDRDGNIEEGATDGVSAYYLSKYGQKIQLGKDPGFNIADKQAALAREAVILSNIKAVAESDKLNGGITITSPYLADPTNAISELQQNSHYDTPRYLEFEVTNEQDLTATFRVIQYPPVVITNIEGYFSYREDFRIGNLPLIYDKNQFSGSYPSCMTMPMDNGEPIHYHNPLEPFIVLASFFPYHIHEWDPKTNRMIKNPTNPTDAHGTCPTIKSYAGFEEVLCGLMERDYMRVDEYKGGPTSGVFHRTHYLWNDGAAFVGANISKPSNYYQNVGPVYEKQHEVDVIDPVTGEVIGKKTITKYYRRHYTGDSFNVFYSKFVELPINSDGTAVIGTQRCDYNYTAPWYMWSVWYPNGNHRMYHIRTTVTSDEYIIGKPNMVTVDGRTYTAEGEANSRMVSPSFMVASMLGETRVPYDRGDGYIVPKEGGLYPLAQRQCEQYVETSFEDTNGNGTWEEGEPVTHYNDWRLPTKAEVALIEKYQNNSRAMDRVLPGETYYCASTVSGVYTAETVLSDAIQGATQSGYYMRCVRDVKPNENK